jgi:hypothetical protein
VGFTGAIVWELIQNLPLILSFVLTVWWWAHRDKRKAIACLVIGSIVNALVIRFTEPSIHGYYETVGTTLVNVVSLGLLMFLFAAYLGSEAKWSNRRIDVLLGGLAGIFLGTAQGLASSGDLMIGIVLHSLALALAAPVVLIGIRALKGQTLSTALKGALLVSVMMTIIISLLDYSYFLVGLD